MKAVRLPKRATVKLGTNFRGVNNGLRQTTQEIMQELREGDAAQHCPSEILNPIRQAYMISAGKVGYGVVIIIKAAKVALVVDGGVLPGGAWAPVSGPALNPPSG